MKLKFVVKIFLFFIPLTFLSFANAENKIQIKEFLTSRVDLTCVFKVSAFGSSGWEPIFEKSFSGAVGPDAGSNGVFTTAKVRDWDLFVSLIYDVKSGDPDGDPDSYTETIHASVEHNRKKIARSEPFIAVGKDQWLPSRFIARMDYRPYDEDVKYIYRIQCDSVRTLK